MSSSNSSDVPLNPAEAWVGGGADESEHAKRRAKLAQKHWGMLRASAFVVLMAFLLQVRPDHRVQFLWGPNIALPESCGSKIYLGIECPGCGLTRGFISIARGDFFQAWQFNRVSILLVIALLLQFPYRWWSLRQIHRGRIPDIRWANWFGLSLIAVLIGNWLLKVVGI
jgi:hypothetical protein